ncbi:MAG: phosphoribosylanthranilate isomerase [Prevotellaceae bacterium]|jgi:phosphoribosylanthranilate isomerase|nr:phosphoribosylanthranilate isomerase [Prevotellaceae bacterium]
MKIKVCGMNNAENIAEISALNPDFMGFIFYNQSPRYAGNLNPSALDVLPDGILRVGVFVNAAPDYVLSIAENYSLNLLQFHGNETPEYCAGFKKNYRTIKSFGIASPSDFSTVSNYERACDYFLFDTKTKQYGGSGQKFDHSLLNMYKNKIPFFLSGGISEHDAAEISKYRHSLCKVLDINSRFEFSPGIKNYEKIKIFMDTVRKNNK